MLRFLRHGPLGAKGGQGAPLLCDPTIRIGGQVIAELRPGLSPHAVQAWVEGIASSVGVSMDWHLVEGRPHVLFMGGNATYDRVRQAIEIWQGAYNITPERIRSRNGIHGMPISA